jgi:arabinose-5-phosphate isomerase
LRIRRGEPRRPRDDHQAGRRPGDLWWSGETAELRSIVFYSRRFKVPFIALTSRADSTLARSADVVLQLPKVEEACPRPRADHLDADPAGARRCACHRGAQRAASPPTISSSSTGGSLGANLQHVRDVMHEGDRVPLARSAR